MKKVLFVAIIATLIAVGCEKTEIINPNLGTEILFSPELGKLTKAPGDPTTLQNQGFKVTAIMAYDDLNTSLTEFGGIYDQINNTQFVYNQTTGWAPKAPEGQNPQQYWWPGQNKDLVFLAISSAKATMIPEVTIVQGSSNGITMTPYTISNFEVDAPGTPVEGENGSTSTTLNPDNDLMIADAVHQNQGENNKVVDLKFRHALSKVQFLFVTNGQNVQNEYPALILSVDQANISTSESAEFTVVYKPDANTTVELTEGYSISCEEDATFTGKVFTTETEGEYTFTASYTADNKIYTSNKVVVTVGETHSQNVVGQTANENITVVVKSIKVANVISKGNLQVSPKWDGESIASSYTQSGENATFKWVPSTDVDDKDNYEIETDLTLTTEAVSYATWLVIPQIIKSGNETGNETGLQVEVAYQINGKPFTRTFPLYTADLKEWGVNQYIKYTINISPELITFNPSVEDWTTNPDVNQNN